MLTGKRMRITGDNDDDGITTREAGSGLATGRRMHKPVIIRIATDENGDAYYEVLSPRDAASGMPTGKRMRITGDSDDDGITTREAGSGLATGRRMHKPVTIRIATDENGDAYYEIVSPR